MKRTVIALLAFALFVTGVSAQVTEKIAPEYEQSLRRLDSLQLDSVYKYWDNFVTEHPKDEKAWRKLVEVEHEMVEQRWFFVGTEKQGGEQLRKQLNVVPRMAKAIPGTYTYYYSYVYEQQRIPSAYVDSAVSVLPKDASADDYDLWVNYLFNRKDSLLLNKVLTLYYESGQYPVSALQYDYNELQGMEKGGVYLSETRNNIIGKLILQRVLGVHKDKILCTVGNVRKMFESIGIPFSDEIFKSFSSLRQDERQTAVMRYTFEHSKRPIYLSACSRFVSKMPDDLKACLYNEGLTMHYSAKPYDNMAVKRRNVEQRYLMDYLVLQFHPEVKSYDLAKSASSLAFNYMVLLYDLMPYYKKHNAEQYAKLNRVLTGIMKPLRGRGRGESSGKFYEVSFSEDGGPHYEFAEGSYYRGDPNEDPETERQKRQELFEKTKRVLIKTEPIE